MYSMKSATLSKHFCQACRSLVVASVDDPLSSISAFDRVGSVQPGQALKRRP